MNSLGSFSANFLRWFLESECHFKYLVFEDILLFLYRSFHHKKFGNTQLFKSRSHKTFLE